MEYLFLLVNASLTLRTMQYLQACSDLPLRFVTVLYQLDGWVVKIKMDSPPNMQQHGDLRAFLHEMGTPYLPTVYLSQALLSLAVGESSIDVMHRYQVFVVSHGTPDESEIEAFRHLFLLGLGYCPETLT